MFSVIKTIGRKSLATLKSQSELLPVVFLLGLLVSSAIAFANQNMTNYSTIDNPNITESLNVNLETEVIFQNETSSTENVTADIPLSETNETNIILPIEGKTNQTENVSESLNETNETIDITIPNVTENVTIKEPTTIIPRLEAKLDVEISYPERITRGEAVTIKATIVNSDSTRAKSVILTWQLPSGFEIVSGNEEKDCGDLFSNDSCVSEIFVLTSYSAELGKNEIKVLVNYES